MANTRRGETANTWLGHPRGLLTLFGTEAWERFSFYGMRALLVLYLLAALDVPAERAYAIYGVYGAMCYGSAVVGGWAASRWLGDRQSIIYGAVTMALGHLVLSIPSLVVVCLGLALICVGNGMFKPNISNSVGKLYADDDPRRQRGYYIFYLGINLGSMSAPLVCGPLGQGLGWHYGFAAAGVGMLVGLAWYLHGLPRLPAEPPRPHSVQTPWVMGAIGVAVVVAGVCLWVPALGHAVVIVLSVGALAVLVMLALRSAPGPRRRVLALIVLMLFHTVFWAAFEQAGSTFNVLTDRYVDRTLGDLEIPASVFQAVNGFFIVVLTPFVIRGWQWLAQRNLDPSIPTKFAFGLLGLAAGFFVIAWGTKRGANVASVGLGWMIACYLFHTLGELCLSPVGLSVVNRLLPERLGSFGMGAWFMTYANGHILASLIATLTVNPETSRTKASAATELLRYSDVFDGVFRWVAAAACLLWMLSPWLRRWIAIPPARAGA